MLQQPLADKSDGPKGTSWMSAAPTGLQILLFVLFLFYFSARKMSIPNQGLTSRPPRPNL